MSGPACPLRASRWRTCASDSSRLASIFSASAYALTSAAEAGDFRRAEDGARHFLAAHLRGGRDALDLELEFVDVARPAHRFVVGDDVLLKQAEDRLIE